MYSNEEIEEDDEFQKMIEGRADDECEERRVFLELKASVEKKANLKSKASIPSKHNETDRDYEANDCEHNERDDPFVDDQNEEEDELNESTNARDDEAIEVPAKKTVKPKIRRVVKNPRPKLDVFRLKSERGLVALPKLFAKMKFKGSGHEKDDLNRIMAVFEHWAHRLMPNMSFDDFIEKVETLGTKRQMQTFMTKMRLDLPLDTVVENVNERSDGDDEMISFDDNTEPTRIDPEAEFDKIIEKDKLLRDEENMNSSIESSNTQETDANFSDSTHSKVNVPKLQLSEEQLKIIEEKRREALELRKKRMQASQLATNCNDIVLNT
ncbi:Protein TIPIN like protein-like protein, partial [Dinothrombium tinctorium]